MEHADEVVERGVLRPLLVMVVELVELGQEHPARKRQEEEDVLLELRDAHLRPVRAEQE